MRSPKETEKFIRAASVGANEARNASVLNRMLEAYANSAPAAPAQRPDYWGLIFENRLARFAAAAVILLSLAILIGQFGALLTGGNVAWADVTQRFQSVPFFSATIYMKEDAASEPAQMELWMSRDGRVRLRMGTQVVFARGGKVIKAYDIKSRQPAEASELATAFVEKIGHAGEFSLDAIIAVMFGGRATEVTPLVNPDAVISQDMVVFDVELPDTPEWVRIWALRESRLPVRISVWNPRDGAATDAVFTYSREQPDEFFDPNAFAGLLRSGAGSSRVSIAYAFLKDPGGRDITPEEMFAGSGYHMPVVKQAGMTQDGAFWVLAGKARNQMPNGTVFYGFSRIQDDLGRTYVSVAGGHRMSDDTSLNVFVPIDFPFDDNRPSQMTLICETRTDRPDVAPELVGTTDLAQWDRDVPCPDLFSRDSRGSPNLRVALAYKLGRPEHAERLTRLLQAIPGWTEQPENEQLLSFWMSMAERRKDFTEAVKIGEVLTPLLMARPRGQSRYSFTEHIVALAATGRLDEAAALFARVNSIDELSPEKSNERYYGTYLERIIRSLSLDAKLTVEQINEILGFYINKHDAYRRVAEQARQDVAFRKSKEEAERRVGELEAYYRTHPLPGKAELVERTKDQRIYLGGDRNVLPGHDGYKILPINYAISGVVSNLRSIGAEKSDASGVHPYQAAIRFGEGLEDRELRADLVYREGIELAECFHLVLAACGVELTTETLPTRPVLVARHDGRKLRNHLEVYGPWHVDDGRTAVRVWHVAELLEYLSQQTQAGVFILDQTGIEEPVCVGGGNPQWQGAEGIEQACRWLQEQFGVTITEETRSITTYLIQRRAQ